MPRPYPKEFRDDGVRVVLNRGAKTTMGQIAKDLAVHEGTLAKWLRAAGIDAGNKPRKTTDESTELRALGRRTRLLEQENELLRRAATYLSQGNLPSKSSPPLVRERAAEPVPVAMSCRVLKFSRQHWYRWLAAPISEADLVDAYRVNVLFDAHRDDPEFRYRYPTGEAESARYPMAPRTAWRLYSDNVWISAFGKGPGKNGARPGPPVHDDLCAVTDSEGRTRYECSTTAPSQL